MVLAALEMDCGECTLPDLVKGFWRAKRSARTTSASLC